MHRLAAATLSLMLVASACSAANDAGTRSSTTATPQTTASTTTIAEQSSVDSAGADATLQLFQSLAQGWNENALTWLAAYSDPDVGWEDFLRVQQDTLVALATLVGTADVQISQLPPDVQRPAYELIEHYQQRLNAFDRWARAIVAGDPVAEEAAAAEYNSISNAVVIIPLMEDLLNSPTIRSALQAEGASPADLLDVMLGATTATPTTTATVARPPSPLFDITGNETPRETLDILREFLAFIYAQRADLEQPDIDVFLLNYRITEQGAPPGAFRRMADQVLITIGNEICGAVDNQFVGQPADPADILNLSQGVMTIHEVEAEQAQMLIWLSAGALCTLEVGDRMLEAFEVAVEFSEAEG